MSIKFEFIRPGMVLHDWHRTKMGNTTMSRMTSWPVEIVSVDAATRTAIVRWNYNRATTWHEYQLTKLRRESCGEAQARKEKKP